ncbi:MAG TPA: hypothetical protein VLZ73_10015, partial [Brevundimonas sp.]|nr:hypothetical protein [Brevundimonas sp.]
MGLRDEVRQSPPPPPSDPPQSAPGAQWLLLDVEVEAPPSDTIGDPSEAFLSFCAFRLPNPIRATPSP